MAYLLPSLNYNYDDLEPFFDTKTMEIHHTKHHQAYINNANLALQNTDFDNLHIEEIIKKINDLPENKKNILKNNLGGHLNHSIFWKLLKIGTLPSKELKTAIEKNFGSVNQFKLDFEKVAMSHFGSGWTWLIKNNNKLSIISTFNQDNPLMGASIAGVFGFPILGIDLWEHAYYLKYQNNKINYIKSFWSVLNWNEALSRFLKNN